MVQGTTPEEAPAESSAGQAITFFKPRPNASLEQGDVIPRSAPIIQDTLRKYHQYHVDNPANEMFAVLTQSCDLIKHQGQCKARYIALAPVRSLRAILNREFKEHLIRTPGGLYVLGSTETQARYEDFLAKLINNNDSRHFYIPTRPELQIAEDMCIMLPLSLAIRAEHYDACVAGRVAQLDDLFQAKLGWLLGQQYSRVGTPDWPDAQLQDKVRDVSDRSLSWLPDHEFDQIKVALKKLATDKPEAVVDEVVFQQMRDKVQSKKDLAITAIIKVLVSMQMLEPPPNKKCFELRTKLRNDSDFSKVFPGG